MEDKIYEIENNGKKNLRTDNRKEKMYAIVII